MIDEEGVAGGAAGVGKIRPVI
ncbi:protein of unknown function [Stenotrophomonas maltophilia]|nr:protein of unknown function [Stenotrophomonas maltophilia]